MKKLLAILLSVLMFLGAFAVAEGGSMTIGNVQVSANGEMLLDLSGLELVLAAAEDDSGMGLRLALNYGENGSDEVIAWLSETALALKASFLSDVYFMDIGLIAEQFGEDISIEAAEDVVSQISPEDAAAAQEILAVIMEALEAGVTDGGEVEIDGASYEKIDIEITEAETGKVMDAVFALLENHPDLLENTEFSSFSELRQTVNPQLNASGIVCVGDAGMVVDVTLAVSATMLPAPATLNLYLDCAQGSTEDEQLVHVELTAGMADQSGTLALDLTLADDEGAWIPAEVGNAVDVMSALNDTAQWEKVMGEATSFVMSLMTNVTYILQQNTPAA